MRIQDRRKRALGQLLMVCCAILFTGATCAPQQYPQASWVGVQTERARLGLPAFEWDDELAAIANSRANRMADESRLSHDGTTDYFDCVGRYDYIGEVVGKQPLWEEPEAISWGWQHSSKHYWAVTLPQMKYGAIAAYVGNDGWVYEALWMSSTRPQCKEE